jgi:hypothetical protein
MPPANLDVTLSLTGRRVTFTKDPLEKVHVYRRVPSRSLAWELVALDARSPFLDRDLFPPGTTLEYHVQHLTQQNEYRYHSHLVQLTVE